MSNKGYCDKSKKERRPLIYYLASLLLPTYYKWAYGLEIHGFDNIPAEGSVILASNHVTASDPLFIGCTSKRVIHYMAKASLFKNWFMNWLLRYAGAFPVERGTGGSDALQEAYDLLEAGRIVGVFIEGTRSKTGEPLNPKTGVSLLAYKTHAPIVPVCVIGEGGIVPKKGKKMRVLIGKPIPFEQLNIQEESSMYFRRGAKYIMGEINNLRGEAIADMEKNR